MNMGIEKVILHLDIQKALALGVDINEPDEDKRTFMDKALDLAGYEGDRLFGAGNSCDDWLVQWIAQHGGQTFDELYQQEQDAMLNWAEHHYGCNCRLPFEPRYCK